MNTQHQPNLDLKITSILLAIVFLLSACIPANTPQLLSTVTPVVQATYQPAATNEPPVMASPTAAASIHLTLDSTGIATNLQTETVAAITASDNAPYWQVMPAYTRVTLQGYPITNQLNQPQIFIYPVKELEQANKEAGKMVASLQTLIGAPQEIPEMPFLPLLNTKQVMHTQLQYLDFKNGHGLRYLTQYDQAQLPINNRELFYTYQGLTSDGKYYVAAVLPVTHPSLPADEKVTGNEPAEFTSDFPAYLANLTKTLNVQSPDTFTPDLTRLDAMMSTIEIQ